MPQATSTTSSAGASTAAAAPVSAPASGGGTIAVKFVTIGFSAPAADHGWTGAIAKNAVAQAAKYPDVKLEPVQPTNDVTAQIAAIRTLINKKVDAIVLLPNDGKQLTSVGLEAMAAGIPVVNLDRVFDTPRASRVWIGGDNYGMGVSAGEYIGQTLKAKGVSNPVIGEIAGIDSLPLTQQRSQGFKDALSTFGYKVGPRQAAQFTVAVRPDRRHQHAAGDKAFRRHLEPRRRPGRRGIGRNQAGKPERVLLGRWSRLGERHAADQGRRRCPQSNGALSADDGGIRDHHCAPDRSEQGHERPGPTRSTRLDHAATPPPSRRTTSTSTCRRASNPEQHLTRNRLTAPWLVGSAVQVAGN